MSKFFSLMNKVAVVTGSSRGIGKGIAHRFSELGAKVVISSRKITSCKIVVKEILDNGGVASSFECNISNKNSCEELIDFAIKKYGKLDILVCNAASNPYYGNLADIPDQSFDKIMNNNVKSNLWLCKKSIPHLKKNDRSSIIIVSSIAGLQGVKNLGAYSISKTADLGLIRSLAVELGPNNITVNGEYYIATAMNKLLNEKEKIINFKVDQMISWSLPEHLKDYLFWEEKFTNVKSKV